MADGNPFDEPLQSELDEHQQQQAATLKASSNGNPFDEPLASEKAEDAAATPPARHYSGAAMGSKVPDSILNGPDSTGEAIAGLTGAGLAALTASPLIDTAITHLGGLTKIVQAAKALGWTSIGLKEAHDLYKMVSGDKK